MSDIESLKIFVSVVETGTMTEAGRELALPKSTVSRRLAKLEENLGIKLLHRSTRTVNVTDAGAEYYEVCKRCLAELEEVESRLRAGQNEPSGKLKIAAPFEFGLEFLSTILAEFGKQYPKVEIDLHLGSRHVDLISEGFDLALRAGPLPDSTLIARLITSQQWVIVAAPDYLRRNGTPGSPEELLNHNCLRFRGREQRQRWSLRVEDSERLYEVSGSITADSFLLLLRHAISGTGIVYTPEIFAEKAIAEGSLQPIMQEFWPKPMKIYAIYPSREFMPKKLTLFLKLLQQWG